MSAADQDAIGRGEDGNTSLSPSELAAKLEQLKASATQQYSLKNYIVAAELYSEAAEVQGLINGEMSVENADLLYQYGRCLYHVAVSRSDVLGGKVAGSGAEEPRRKKRKVAPAAAAAQGSAGGLIGDTLKDGEQKMAEEVVGAVVEEKESVKKEEDTNGSKPFFQITGDENFTDSEDEDEADAEAEEEEDDFATAYEILDMARVLLAKKAEAIQAEGKGKESSEDAEQRQVLERLADTHDLQAEISLENERFQDAIKDTRDGLILKLKLYPEESSLVAEAHFKLSLALEFASVTSTADADGEAENSETKVAQVDENLRHEAALEMEKAIASCNARIAKEKSSSAPLDTAKQAEQKKAIADVEDMVADMQQRLVDLRNPAVSLSGATGPAGAPDGSDPLRGVLGAMLGESKVEQQKRIQEATKNANDLTGLVKHKKPKGEDGASDGSLVVDGKGKRKADDGSAEGAGAKKVKFEADA